MKQLLFISAGKAFPEGAFAFIASLKQVDEFNVKGLFFSPLDFDGRITASYVPGTEAYDQTREKEIQFVRKHKERFAASMEDFGIPYSMHDNTEPWSKELFTRETRFADLVIVSGETFYAELDDNQPNNFLHQALRGTESPILVIPENFGSISQLFFAYDGTRESIYAIKQFTYLFPHCSKLPTEVLYAKEEESDGAPDKQLLGAYAHLHYSNISFSKLHFNPAQFFTTWLADKQNVLLVSGSFGRSFLSYMGKKSFVEKIIKEHNIPLFITHF